MNKNLIISYILFSIPILVLLLLWGLTELIDDGKELDNTIQRVIIYILAFFPTIGILYASWSISEYWNLNPFEWWNMILPFFSIIINFLWSLNLFILSFFAG